MIKDPLYTSFLVTAFEDFFKVAHEWRDQVLHNYTPDEDWVAKIQYRLRIILEEQSLNSLKQTAEFAISHYQEAQYIMATLADEIFLAFDWPQRHKWEDNLLEAQLFQTEIAGELIFEKIEDLLKNYDPMKRDLASVYLLSLSLGFKGKYQGQDDKTDINDYRLKLYAYIFHSTPRLFSTGRPHLFQDPYQSTIRDIPRQFMPEAQTWGIIFTITVLGYFLLAYVLWYQSVKDLDNAARFIKDYSSLESLIT